MKHPVLQIVMVSAPGIVGSFLFSLLFHPIVYRRGASGFSQLRLGPGIGVALVLVNVFMKIVVLCQWMGNLAQRRELELYTNLLLAMMWGAVEVAIGTFAADILRAARGEKRTQL